MTEDERLFAEGQKALTDALLQGALTLSKLERAGRTRDIRIANISLFTVLFNFDLRQLLHDVSQQRGTWAAKLYARMLALTMYECAEDFTELLGKDFRRLVTDVGDDDLLATLSSLHSRIRTFFDTNRQYLKAIRTEIVGHRDHQAAVQLQRLRDTKVAELEKLGYDLLRWVNDTYAFMGLVIQAAQANPENAQDA
jgi:hypothetical protein